MEKCSDSVFGKVKNNKIISTRSASTIIMVARMLQYSIIKNSYVIYNALIFCLLN